MRICDNSSYLTSLRVAANSAALPAVIAVAVKKDVAVVSATVISQIRQQPSCQGVNVKPSGRLSSGLGIIIIIIIIIISGSSSSTNNSYSSSSNSSSSSSNSRSSSSSSSSSSISSSSSSSISI